MKVDTALRYFSSSDSYKKPSKILVTGGGANIIGLASFLADRLSLDAVQLDPFKSVQVDNNRFLGMDWNAAASTYAVALGLALRRF
jgi:Tfp pilus assembly PilM family ATPase